MKLIPSQANNPDLSISEKLTWIAATCALLAVELFAMRTTDKVVQAHSEQKKEEIKVVQENFEEFDKVVAKARELLSTIEWADQNLREKVLASASAFDPAFAGVNAQAPEAIQWRTLQNFSGVPLDSVRSELDRLVAERNTPQAKSDSLRDRANKVLSQVNELYQGITVKLNQLHSLRSAADKLIVRRWREPLPGNSSEARLLSPAPGKFELPDSPKHPKERVIYNVRLLRAVGVSERRRLAAQYATSGQGSNPATEPESLADKNAEGWVIRYPQNALTTRPSRVHSRPWLRHRAPTHVAAQEANQTFASVDVERRIVLLLDGIDPWLIADVLSTEPMKLLSSPEFKKVMADENGPQRGRGSPWRSIDAFHQARLIYLEETGKDLLTVVHEKGFAAEDHQTLVRHLLRPEWEQLAWYMKSDSTRQLYTGSGMVEWFRVNPIPSELRAFFWKSFVQDEQRLHFRNNFDKAKLRLWREGIEPDLIPALLTAAQSKDGKVNLARVREACAGLTPAQLSALWGQEKLFVPTPFRSFKELLTQLTPKDADSQRELAQTIESLRLP